MTLNRLDEQLRLRALFYIDVENKRRELEYEESYNLGAFFDDVTRREKNSPHRSSFSRFLSGKSNSTTVRRVIRRFLEEQSFWPNVEDMNTNISIISSFFGGSSPLPDETVKFYTRTFIYYQHSTNHVGKVASSNFTFMKSRPDAADPCFLLAEERSSDAHFTEIFRGSLFRNGEAEIVLLRLDESTHGKNVYGPKLLFVLQKGNPQHGLRWIAGRLLKTSGHQIRHHQSNWFAEEVKQKSRFHDILSEDELLDRSPKAHEVLYNTKYL